MAEIIHKGVCHNMILTFDDPALYNKAVAAVNGGRFQLSLCKEKKEKPIDPLRRYYFSVVVEKIAEETCGAATRANMDRVHKGLEDKFMREMDADTGLYRTLSISDFKAEVDHEMMLWYVKEVEQWASETLGIEWPERNSYEYTDEDAR